MGERETGRQGELVYGRGKGKGKGRMQACVRLRTVDGGALDVDCVNFR